MSFHARADQVDAICRELLPDALADLVREFEGAMPERALIELGVLADLREFMNPVKFKPCHVIADQHNCLEHWAKHIWRMIMPHIDQISASPLMWPDSRLRYTNHHYHDLPQWYRLHHPDRSKHVGNTAAVAAWGR